MIFLYFMRFFCDALFYYSFASLPALLLGSHTLLPGLLIPSICYAAGSRFSEGRWRYLFVLPCLLCFLLPGQTIYDRILALPPVIYAGMLLYRKDRALSAYRQNDLFWLFIKAYPAFYLICAVFGAFGQLNAASLPCAAAQLIISVYLMRILRHDPAVFEQPVLLLRSSIPLFIIGAFAWICSIPAVFHAIEALLLAFYKAAVIPVLTVILAAFTWVVGNTFFPLLQYLVSHLKMDGLSVISDTEADFSAGEFTSSYTGPSASALLVFRTIGAILLLAVVSFLLVFLYRRLTGEKDQKTYAPETTGEHSKADTGSASIFRKDLPLPCPAGSIRRQYRAYLKLCEQKGFTPPASFTSQEIGMYTESLFSNQKKPEIPDQANPDRLTDLNVNAAFNDRSAINGQERELPLQEELSLQKKLPLQENLSPQKKLQPQEELRQLYIQARYGRRATAKQAARAKELLSQLRHS